MSIKLYKGDCLEIMDDLIADNIVCDVIITDPPYGTTKCSWDSVIPFDKMWERLNKLIKPNGAIVLFGSEPFSSALRMSNIKNYKYDWIWGKSNPLGFLNVKKQPLRNYENISIFYKYQCFYNPQMTKGKAYIKNHNWQSSVYGKYNNVITINNGERYPKSILKFTRDKDRYHPTQKPVKLMEYLVKTYTNKNELVLDFTMGSGTAGVACKKLERDFIGIEKDDKYFKIAEDRINKAEVQYDLFQ